MNPVVKAQLNAFASVNSNAALTESELFEVFSIFAVSNGILTDNIDPFSAHLQAHEFGLDGLAIMVQGELCRTSDEVTSILEIGKAHAVEFNLFQAKISESLDYGELSKFFDGAYQFFEGSYVTPTEQLLDLMAAKDAVYATPLKRNPTVRLYFTNTGSGQVSLQIESLVEATRARLQSLNIFEAVEIEILGAKELQAGYRSATNSISASIEINRPITLPEHPAVQQAFLGYVSAGQLVNLVTLPTEEGDARKINKAVFFDNIRDFDPKSEINLGILKEIEAGAQSSFIFKNNGVTVVAREIGRKGDTFDLDDFQVVNGCQTSNILFLAGEKAADVFVPFRLIGSSDPDFIATIIVGTNKQNEVKEDQFWALTPFMKDLEEFCREQPGDLKIFLERRENQYRSEAIERTRICRPSDLVKSIAAMFLFKPHRSARDYRGIRQEFAGKIFQADHQVTPYHSAAFAAYRTDFAIRNKKVQSTWGIYKYFVLAAAGRMATGGSDMFAMKKKDAEVVCGKINELFADEASLLAHYSKVASILDGYLASDGISGREKVRDFIRTEAVAARFETSLAQVT